MFRTRDFAVMTSTIAFLLVAITVTWSGSVGLIGGATQGAAIFSAVSEGEPTYTAVVAEETELSRDERIAALRREIASRGTVAATTETPLENEPAASEVPVATAEVKENRCSDYGQFAGTWTTKGLIIAEVEGARLVYREILPPQSTASGTMPITPARDIVLQLPVRSVPLSSQTCVRMDVIGIATDGSLIRNNEIGMYRVFGPETLVGYALDGFPIYGRGNTATDICGGVMVGGQYRYQLDGERETILNCFAGLPTAL